MLSTLRLMKELKERIGCDEVEFRLIDEGRAVRIIVHKQNKTLQRTYSDIEIQQIMSPQIILDSVSTYMRTALDQGDQLF